MKSLADALSPEIARQIDPAWRKNEAAYWAVRDQVLGHLESGCYADRLAKRPYRFYFYSHEPNEPPHVHVDRDDLSAKFWLQPVGLARNFGFSPKELRRYQKPGDSTSSGIVGGLAWASWR